ncbi:MAG: hypothetical protein ABW039_14135, partial [Sphingobium sp.]
MTTGRWIGDKISAREIGFSDLYYEVTKTEPEDETTPEPKYEIFSYPADTTLKGYLEQWTNNQLSIPA